MYKVLYLDSTVNVGSLAMEIFLFTEETTFTTNISSFTEEKTSTNFTDNIHISMSLVNAQNIIHY